MSNFYFLNDVENKELKKEYQIKYIICNLFANATIDDFNNPVDFLRSRTIMFDNRIIGLEEEIDLGYLESINARIFVKEEKVQYVLKHLIESKVILNLMMVINYYYQKYMQEIIKKNINYMVYKKLLYVMKKKKHLI